MDFKKVITERKSIRKYDTNKLIPDDVLARIFEAVRIAPSACNIQPSHLIVITDPDVKEKLKESYSKDWFWTAPVIIAGCVDTKASYKRKDGKDFSEVDLTIAMDHLILAAANEGLGTCWIGAFDNKKAREILRVPEHVNIIAMTPLGYPEENPSPRQRKTLEEIIHKNIW